ncbi:limb region 1 protein homolog isoform X3 [Pongo pygmaeus]|uniref:limb region 1 protein homolog isoform X3 n=1 Tax=Pongo pygmaeus TaxID=9600 RepID=UPI0023E29C74|nr:limb region 1 protein homolog isoform X3 [Pongo pygmaeus]XP_054416041.1 limb region 1 protein homolog isoform X3 [Pongo abelii]
MKEDGRAGRGVGAGAALPQPSAGVHDMFPSFCHSLCCFLLHHHKIQEKIRPESSGAIMADCSLDLLGSSDSPTSASWTTDEQEDEDAIVNRISLFLSTFTLAVSAGAVLLLPFSIISNEILLSFPQNYYIQWLNGSLIHGLWNLASLFSNLCLFVLMPFAFFFLESEGFAGLKKGIRARILETLVMLLLLALLILGIVWVASALIDNDAASMESLYDLWEFYLPYLYSCISLMGCLLLLLCTPVGLSRMFTVMGQLLVKPTILEDLDEQIYIITLEEEALQRRLNGLSSSVEYNIMELEQELENVKTLKTKLERRKKASAWERNLVYPAVMVLLLIETSISVLLVACNILCLLVDETAMPKGTRGPGIGNASLSTFGFVGAALEIILIFYLMVSSVVGFYSLRFFGNFTPKKDDTTMTKIIGNCVSILVLSSALPVMSRTLGHRPCPGVVGLPTTEHIPVVSKVEFVHFHAFIKNH